MLIFVVGMFADQKLDERYARRDAMLVNYIKTHPEDFPIEGDCNAEVPFFLNCPTKITYFYYILYSNLL